MEVNLEVWSVRDPPEFNKMDEVNNNWTTDNIDNTHATTTENPQHYFLPWWQQAIFYTMFVFIFVVAAGGNIIVVWIVLAHKRMRTVTNYFLVNLAIADVMVSFFNVLFHFVLNLYQDWFFGLEYCKVAFFTASCTISVSVLTFMAIAIDRFATSLTQFGQTFPYGSVYAVT